MEVMWWRGLIYEVQPSRSEEKEKKELIDSWCRDGNWAVRGRLEGKKT